MVRSRWSVCPAQWTVMLSVDSSESATSPGLVDSYCLVMLWFLWFSSSPKTHLAQQKNILLQGCCLTASLPLIVFGSIFQPQEGYLMVRQFQYLGWAGHREVPASKRSFLKLILQVDQWQREGEEGEGRTIVHCL